MENGHQGMIANTTSMQQKQQLRMYGRHVGRGGAVEEEDVTLFTSDG